MSQEAHNIQKEVRGYIFVFIGLLILTILTVLASNLQVGVAFGILLALVIATVKGSMVARHFMHLKSEQNLVYFVLILAALFFAGMMFLICFSHFSTPQGVQFVP